MPKPTPQPADEPVITKRRVTMRNVMAIPADGDRPYNTVEIVSTDYVLPEHLDAYVADAHTKWQQVEVSEEPDAGPGGYHGATYVPAHLNVPDAGTMRPATD